MAEKEIKYALVKGVVHHSTDYGTDYQGIDLARHEYASVIKKCIHKPVYLDHDYSAKPLGIVMGYEEDDAGQLSATLLINISTERGKKVKEGLESGHINGLSFGILNIFKNEQDVAYQLPYEISVTSDPQRPNSYITMFAKGNQVINPYEISQIKQDLPQESIDILQDIDNTTTTRMASTTNDGAVAQQQGTATTISAETTSAMQQQMQQAASLGSEALNNFFGSMVQKLRAQGHSDDDVKNFVKTMYTNAQELEKLKQDPQWDEFAKYKLLKQEEEMRRQAMEQQRIAELRDRVIGDLKQIPAEEMERFPGLTEEAINAVAPPVLAVLAGLGGNYRKTKEDALAKEQVIQAKDKRIAELERQVKETTDNLSFMSKAERYVGKPSGPAAAADDSIFSNRGAVGNSHVTGGGGQEKRFRPLFSFEESAPSMFGENTIRSHVSEFSGGGGGPARSSMTFAPPPVAASMAGAGGNYQQQKQQQQQQQQQPVGDEFSFLPDVIQSSLNNANFSMDSIKFMDG